MNDKENPQDGEKKQPQFSIHIGGAVSGSSVVAGTDNIVFTSYKKVTLPPPESVNIGETLESLVKALAELSLKQQGHAEIAEAMKEATTEAKAANPDKGKIGRAVEKALTVAKTAIDFAGVCEKAGPYVMSAAAWLGANFHHLLQLVGLAKG